MDIWKLILNQRDEKEQKRHIKPLGRIIAYPRGETAQVPPTSNFPLKAAPRPLSTPDLSVFPSFLLIITEFKSCLLVQFLLLGKWKWTIPYLAYYILETNTR